MTHLKAVLIRHQLLGFALIGSLGTGSGCLGGLGATGGIVGTLAKIKISHLYTDLITDYMLQLWEKDRKKRENRVKWVCASLTKLIRELLCMQIS